MIDGLSTEDKVVHFKFAFSLNKKQKKVSIFQLSNFLMFTYDRGIVEWFLTSLISQGSGNQSQIRFSLIRIQGFPQQYLDTIYQDTGLPIVVPRYNILGYKATLIKRTKPGPHLPVMFCTKPAPWTYPWCYALNLDPEGRTFQVMFCF